MNRFLPTDLSLQLLHQLIIEGQPFQYDQEKHRIVLLDEKGEEKALFRLPIVVPPPSDIENTEAYKVNYIILLIQAGHCAMGYYENGVNLNHKVFTSYMVRMKQGKSQIKYLKTKGKSRAGSRVRLGETVEFFENINGRLQTYFAEHQVHRIAMSCSKTLLPYLYDSNVATPFDKRDERILKIPKHVHVPKYEVMVDINKYLLKGELIYEPEKQDFIDKLLGQNASSLLDGESEDNEVN